MSAGETNQVKERIATLQNATLAYIREGSGVPLLCLHGGMGVDSASLRVPGILKLAERGCDLVVFDQRGHGNSAAAAASAYSNELWATDALQLGRRLGWERMALLGHSYGGFIALAYAVRWAQTLSHLVLVSTSAGPVTTAAPFCLTDREVHDHLQRQWPGFFAGPDKHWDLFEKLRFWVSPYNDAFFRELPKYDLRSKVREITTPALLIVGTHDHYRDDMEWLARELPSASLLVFQHVGHFPFVEQPDKFLEAVSAFLTGPERSSNSRS